MIDLGAARDLGGILNACWRLYRAHFGVFAAIALAVVVPMDLITLGLIEGHLTGGFDLDEATGGPASSIVQTLVTVPLITGAHVTAVMSCGRGEKPTVGGSLSEASGAFPALIGTVVLYSVGVALGLLAVIVGAFYLATRWYVATQSVVAEGRGPVDALRRSGELVSGQWWRVFGIGLVIALIGAVAGGVVAVPIGAIAAAADSGPLLVLGNIALDTVILSFTALAGSLLFFDLQARHAGAAPIRQTWPPSPPPDQPERPLV